jgi:hypothetical protein
MPAPECTKLGSGVGARIVRRQGQWPWHGSGAIVETMSMNPSAYKRDSVASRGGAETARRPGLVGGGPHARRDDRRARDHRARRRPDRAQHHRPPRSGARDGRADRSPLHLVRAQDVPPRQWRLSLHVAGPRRLWSSKPSGEPAPRNYAAGAYLDKAPRRSVGRALSSMPAPARPARASISPARARTASPAAKASTPTSSFRATEDGDGRDDAPHRPRPSPRTCSGVHPSPIPSARRSSRTVDPGTSPG